MKQQQKLKLSPYDSANIIDLYTMYKSIYLDNHDKTLIKIRKGNYFHFIQIWHREKLIMIHVIIKTRTLPTAEHPKIKSSHKIHVILSKSLTYHKF